MGLVFDMNTGELSSVSLGPVPRGVTTNMWASAVVVESTIYGIPFDAYCILVFDTISGEISGIAINDMARCDEKWGDAVIHDDKIYYVPHNADCWLVLDTATEEISTIPCNPGNDKWVGAVLIEM